MLIKLPKVFFDDHAGRDLPTPAVVRETVKHYFVASNDPALPELKSDAEHYSHDVDQCERGLIASARATLRALA